LKKVHTATHNRLPLLSHSPLLVTLAAVAPTEAVGLKSGFRDKRLCRYIVCIFLCKSIYIYIYLRDAQRKPDLVKPNAVLLRPGGADFLIASFCFRFRAFVLFGLLTSIQHLPTIVYICWFHKCCSWIAHIIKLNQAPQWVFVTVGWCAQPKQNGCSSN
jgi:hypothetical protein